MPNEDNINTNEEVVNEEVEEQVDSFYDDEGEEIEEPGSSEGQEDEEFEEIQYNKESIKIPKSKVKEYLQKGYHSDKVYQQRDEYKTKLEEIERRTGKKADDFIKEQEQQSLNQEIQELVDEEGWSEKRAKDYVLQKRKLAEIEAKTAINQMNETNKQSMTRWEKEEPAIFNAIKDKCMETMKVNNVTFDIAYQYVKGGMSFAELSKIQNSNNSTSRVNNEYNNRRRGGVVSNADGKGHDYSVEIKSPAIRRLNKALGIDNNKAGKAVKSYREQYKT